MVHLAEGLLILGGVLGKGSDRSRRAMAGLGAEQDPVSTFVQQGRRAGLSLVSDIAESDAEFPDEGNTADARPIQRGIL